MRSRLGISVIGQVEYGTNAHGRSGVIAHGWRFLSPSDMPLPEGTDVPIAPDALGGWTSTELHNIAHGVPCDCPIGQILAEDGWPDV